MYAKTHIAPQGFLQYLHNSSLFLAQEVWPSLVLFCLQDLTRSQEAGVAAGQQPCAVPYANP